MLARPRLVLQCQARVSLTCPMLQPAADSKSLSRPFNYAGISSPLRAGSAGQATATHPRLATSAGQAGTAAPPTHLRHHPTPPAHASIPPAHRLPALMLFQGSEGLTQLRLTRVLTPLKWGQRNSVPMSQRVSKGGEGALVLLEVLGPPCQRPAAALAGLPCACTADICRIIHIFRLWGGSGLRFPLSQLSLSLPAHWGGSTVSPSLPADPWARPSCCLPRARTRQGTPHFTPTKCF